MVAVSIFSLDPRDTSARIRSHFRGSSADPQASAGLGPGRSRCEGEVQMLLSRGGRAGSIGLSGNDRLNGGPGRDGCSGGRGRDSVRECELRVSVTR